MSAGPKDLKLFIKMGIMETFLHILDFQDNKLIRFFLETISHVFSQFQETTADQNIAIQKFYEIGGNQILEAII